MAAYLDSGSSSVGSGAPGGGGGGIQSLLSSGGIAGLIGAGAGLIPSLLGNNNVPYTDQQQGIVTQLGQVGSGAASESGNLYNTGSMFLNALATGQLPPGANNVVDQLVNKQITDTKAKYASLGQTGSTMEQDALNQIQNNKGALTFQIAQQMAQTGLQATQQSLQALGIEASADNAQASIYNNLMQAQMKNNANLFTSIGNFTGALAKALPAIAAA